MHRLRTPNEGINQRYLKKWSDVADKICFGRAVKAISSTGVRSLCSIPPTTDTQRRHKSKKYENLVRCGRQNMLRPYLNICEWEWIFGLSVKAISSPGVRRVCLKLKKSIVCRSNWKIFFWILKIGQNLHRVCVWGKGKSRFIIFVLNEYETLSESLLKKIPLFLISKKKKPKLKTQIWAET